MSNEDATVARDAAARDATMRDADGTLPDGAPEAAPAPSGPHVVYVGTYSTVIHVFEMDPVSLALAPTGEVTTSGAPSFLAFDAQARWLVTVNESAGSVESFRIAPDTGALTLVNGASSGGAGPAHVSTDASGNWVLVANYESGSVSVIPITAEGSLGASIATVQAGANAHQILTDESNTTAYVPCKGTDRVAVYAFDAGSGTLTPREPATAPAGSGPRHIGLAPSGGTAWVMNELASTVTTYAVGSQGTLTMGSTVSSLPAGFSGTNTGAEIAVHPSGQWVYASNRGHDSIAVFDVAADGSLTLIENVPTGGDEPRHFSLILGGSALLVANQISGTIHGFRVDAGTGRLTAVGQLASGLSLPAFVAALRLP